MLNFIYLALIFSLLLMSRKIFERNEGSWGPAINIGKQFNSTGWNAYASVTSDGKCALFIRNVAAGNSNIH